MRRTLPTRRPSNTRTITWQGHELQVNVGLHPKTLKAAEAFADTKKGGQIQATLSDACVLISIALQHGIPLEAMGKSLAHEPIVGGEGIAPASPVGAVVEALIAWEQDEWSV